MQEDQNRNAYLHINELMAEHLQPEEKNAPQLASHIPLLNKLKSIYGGMSFADPTIQLNGEFDAKLAQAKTNDEIKKLKNSYQNSLDKLTKEKEYREDLKQKLIEQTMEFNKLRAEYNTLSKDFRTNKATMSTFKSMDDYLSKQLQIKVKFNDCKDNISNLMESIENLNENY